MPMIYQCSQGLHLKEDLLALSEINTLPVWWLSQIQNRFKLRAKNARQRSPDYALAADRLETVARQALEARKQLRLLIKTLKSAVPLYERPIIRLSAAHMTTHLKINLYPWLVDGAYPVLEHDERTSLLYHPYCIPHCIYILVRGLNRLRAQSKAKISFRQTSSWFQMALTCDGLHLRPDLWESLLDPDRTNVFEIVYEMGGQIEPLTWDEGQGEGVIVRLPWARSSEDT
jgi:hypothetical protein